MMLGSNSTEKKLKLCISFLVKEVVTLDPVIRRQWLSTYKSSVEFATFHGSTELDDEQLFGSEIYKEVIRQVEEWIESEEYEEYEGENFNRFKSRDPLDTKYEKIYQKRLKQIQEDFPVLKE